MNQAEISESSWREAQGSRKEDFRQKVLTLLFCLVVLYWIQLSYLNLVNSVWAIIPLGITGHVVFPHLPTQELFKMLETWAVVSVQLPCTPSASTAAAPQNGGTVTVLCRHSLGPYLALKALYTIHSHCPTSSRPLSLTKHWNSLLSTNKTSVCVCLSDCKHWVPLTSSFYWWLCMIQLPNNWFVFYYRIPMRLFTLPTHV